MVHFILIIQVLEDSKKVILEVSFCFPQCKRKDGRGESISSYLDLSLLSGFLVSQASSTILCSRGQWIIHLAPAKFLLCLLHHYYSSKPSITIEKNVFVVKHLRATHSTFQMVHYQLQVRCAFVSLATTFSGWPPSRRRLCARETRNTASFHGQSKSKHVPEATKKDATRE